MEELNYENINFKFELFKQIKKKQIILILKNYLFSSALLNVGEIYYNFETLERLEK